jgi:hypothetical protein
MFMERLTVRNAYERSSRDAVTLWKEYWKTFTFTLQKPKKHCVIILFWNIRNPGNLLRMNFMRNYA